MVEERITELPLLEAHLWAEVAYAELDGRHEESVEMAEMLRPLGYEVAWLDVPRPHVLLRHVGTGQTMRWWMTAT